MVNILKIRNIIAAINMNISFRYKFIYTTIYI